MPKTIEVEWDELKTLTTAVQTAFNGLGRLGVPLELPAGIDKTDKEAVAAARAEITAAANKAYKLAVMELAMAAQPYVAALKK